MIAEKTGLLAGLFYCLRPLLFMPGLSARHEAFTYGRLLHAEQFDIEHQGRVRRNDAARAAGAVAKRGRNDQGTLAADLHGGDALVPATDHPAAPDRKLERLVAVDGAVEFLALLAVLVQPAGIVHDAGLAGLGRSAGADRGVDNLQA